MKKALEGLSGVSKVEMDVEQDLFRVTLAGPEVPTPEALFKVVRDLGYTPTLGSPESFRGVEEAFSPRGAPPDIVRNALVRAKAEQKLVLVDCMGDN